MHTFVYDMVMKLSDFAKQQGISYRTAWRWYHSGKIKGYQAGTGTIIITESEEDKPPQKVVIYTRVSSSENKANLDTQAERLLSYCAANGWQVNRVVKEIGSGVNDNRQKFLSLLADPTITVIVVEHKDRASRFGVRYIETLLDLQGRKLEVVNLADNGREDLIEDFVSIIHSFCSRLYGQRRGKRKTENITKELMDATG